MKIRASSPKRGGVMSSLIKRTNSNDKGSSKSKKNIAMDESLNSSFDKLGWSLSGKQETEMPKRGRRRRSSFNTTLDVEVDCHKTTTGQRLRALFNLSKRDDDDEVDDEYEYEGEEEEDFALMTKRNRFRDLFAAKRRNSYSDSTFLVSCAMQSMNNGMASYVD